MRIMSDKASTNQAHDEQHNIYDLGLQADLTMWTKAPIERRRILKLGALGIGGLLAGCGNAGNTTTPTTSTTAPAATATPATTAATTAAATTAAPTTAAATAAATTAPAAASTALPTISTTVPTAIAASTVTAAKTTAATAAAATAVQEIPQETAGPFPADGSRASNGTLNVLTQSGIVRSDIRTSLGTGKVAAGIPTTIELTLVAVNKNNAPLAGYALYIWHCDRDGNYSLYSNGVTNEDYLRGVQQADSNGTITFASIFPACYPGRWPHVHFEVYPSLAAATSSSNAINTSQLALPADVCNVAYATTGYETSVSSLSRVTLDSDNVFRDGHDWQVAKVTGDATNGYKVALTVGVAAA